MLDIAKLVKNVCQNVLRNIYAGDAAIFSDKAHFHLVMYRMLEKNAIKEGNEKISTLNGQLFSCLQVNEI